MTIILTCCRRLSRPASFSPLSLLNTSFCKNYQQKRCMYYVATRFCNNVLVISNKLFRKLTLIGTALINYQSQSPCLPWSPPHPTHPQKSQESNNQLQGVSKKKVLSCIYSCFCSRSRILLFHMCFGIRILSPFHLSTQTMPIQNMNCTKNACTSVLNLSGWAIIEIVLV